MNLVAKLKNFYHIIILYYFIILLLWSSKVRISFADTYFVLIIEFPVDFTM